MISRTLAKSRVLPICRDTVGVFKSPSNQGQRTLIAGKCLTHMPRCSRCIQQPQQSGPNDTHCGGRVLPICRDTVGVFSSHSNQGQTTHIAGKGLTLMQKCSWCIQQPQPSGPNDTHCGGRVLPIYRDTVGVFNSPSNQGKTTLIAGEGSYPYAEIQSVYSTAPAIRAKRHSLRGKSLTHMPRYSRCIQQPQQSGPKDTHCGGRVLPICRDTVGVFSSHRNQGQTALIAGKSLTFMQKCSRCI